MDKQLVNPSTISAVKLSGETFWREVAGLDEVRYRVANREGSGRSVGFALTDTDTGEHFVVTPATVEGVRYA